MSYLMNALYNDKNEINLPSVAYEGLSDFTEIDRKHQYKLNYTF